MSYCANCGKIINVGHNFCTNCGTAVLKSNSKIQVEEHSRSQSIKEINQDSQIDNIEKFMKEISITSLNAANTLAQAIKADNSMAIVGLIYTYVFIYTFRVILYTKKVLDDAFVVYGLIKFMEENINSNTETILSQAGLSDLEIQEVKIDNKYIHTRTINYLCGHIDTGDYFKHITNLIERTVIDSSGYFKISSNEDVSKDALSYVVGYARVILDNDNVNMDQFR